MVAFARNQWLVGWVAKVWLVGQESQLTSETLAEALPLLVGLTITLSYVGMIRYIHLCINFMITNKSCILLYYSFCFDNKAIATPSEFDILSNNNLGESSCRTSFIRSETLSFWFLWKNWHQIDLEIYSFLSANPAGSLNVLSWTQSQSSLQWLPNASGKSNGWGDGNIFIFFVLSDELQDIVSVSLDSIKQLWLRNWSRWWWFCRFLSTLLIIVDCRELKPRLMVS